MYRVQYLVQLLGNKIKIQKTTAFKFTYNNELEKEAEKYLH